MIPYGKQNINKEDIESVLSVLKSDFLTQGPITPEFERELSSYCGSKYSVAVVNATSALHLACIALEVGPGDLVWTSPISFVASANCAKYCGADVDFVDIDPVTYNMSIDSLESKLEVANLNGKLPKVVIPVHLSGQSCDMQKIKSLSLKYSFKIIEDASHAIGGEYLGNKIGSCEFSDITVFSFHPVKIITTCEGGVCMTNNSKLFESICNKRSHGILRSNNDFKNKSDGGWYYEQQSLGFNYRLNDLQSALGISQLKRIDEFIKQRNDIAKKYNQLFEGVEGITTPKINNNCLSSYHLYIIRVDQNKLEGRNLIFEKLRNNGILVNIHYIPIYRQPYYENDYDKGNFINSEKYYSDALSLPIYPGLSENQINEICKIIIKKANFQNLF